MKSLALVLCLLASTAHAQDLPAGWTRVARVIGGAPTAASCTASTAYLREWSGTVIAFDGNAGTRLPALTPSAYGRSISADASGHAMIATQDGLAIYDGGWIAGSWSIVPVTGARREIRGVLSLDDTHAYFVTDGAIGVREDDHFAMYGIGTWRSMEAIAGRNANDLWAAGQGGTVMHWDGRSWSREATNSDLWLHGIATSASDVWAWSGTTLIHRDASAWSTIPSTVGNVVSIATGASTFVIGDAGVARWSGGSFTSELEASVLGNYASFATGCATEHFLAVVLSTGDVLTRAL